MNDALNLLYYIATSFFNWIFNQYLFTGVSLGMILIVSCVFYILLHYVLAIPRIKVGVKYDKKD